MPGARRDNSQGSHFVLILATIGFPGGIKPEPLKQRTLSHGRVGLA